MPTTAELELYGTPTTGVRLPVTGWMRIPETHKLLPIAIKATEVDDDAVQVGVYAEYSANNGFSAAGSAQFAISGGYHTLNADVWQDVSDEYNTDDDLDGYTHVRLLVDCKAVGSAPVPFRALLLYEVVRRPVTRVAVEPRLVANDATSSTMARWRLTGPVRWNSMEAFRVRAILRIENGADEGSSSFTVRPYWFQNNDPMDADWGGSGELQAVSWTTLRDPQISDAKALDENDWALPPGIAFGVQVWDGAGVGLHHAGRLSGVFELYTP